MLLERKNAVTFGGGGTIGGAETRQRPVAPRGDRRWLITQGA